MPTLIIWLLVGVLCIGAVALNAAQHITYKCPRCGAPMKRLGSLNRLICTSVTCKLQLTNA